MKAGIPAPEAFRSTHPHPSLFPTTSRPQIVPARLRTHLKALLPHLNIITPLLSNGSQESSCPKGKDRRLRPSACQLPRYVASKTSTTSSRSLNSAFVVVARHPLTRLHRHGQGSHRERKLSAPAHRHCRRRSPGGFCATGGHNEQIGSHPRRFEALLTGAFDSTAQGAQW
jgi:hypothetical protein